VLCLVDQCARKDDLRWGNQTIAGVFSPLTQYPIDVSKDLLLIYNVDPTATNSLGVRITTSHTARWWPAANVLPISDDKPVIYVDYLREPASSQFSQCWQTTD